MKEKVKIGYIGLGRRGKSVLKNSYSQMSDVEIVMLCDLSQNRLEAGKQIVLENGGYEPALTTDYREVIHHPDIDAVVIMIGWSGRPQMAMESMKAGKYTAIEVGCADTIDECFDLIRTYEETKAPLMMLENCCYGRREMMVLRMVREGLFGELVHCTGGYHHYLNAEDLFKGIDTDEIPHYRIGHYERCNRENYPTHELGPISKVLNINRGNRMVRLSSFASKSVGLKHYAGETFGADSRHAKKEYKQGDIVNTIITCAGGETIQLTLDTTLPRAYYSRNFSVRGTKAMSSEEGHVVYFPEMGDGIRENETEMFAKYDHPLHAEYVSKGVKAGHGGMDWLVNRAFVESVKHGCNTPIDAYDTVAWMAIGPLSEQSIAMNGAPVEIPDFTNGKWENPAPALAGKYSLDVICEDPDVSVV
ncbi:MAG: Gfo/Idh/MocA family oxidoreductase [Ruminococcaceae bacterium]|nr:Gfo/Idh/MocA family oxidoreductase [Oscillospiraceae bacterium]